MYYLVLLLGLIFAIFEKKFNKNWLYCYALVLLILAIFRFGVGADYFAYNYNYITAPEELSALTQRFSNDLLFAFFLVLFRKIGFSYQIFVALLSVINIFFLYILVSKNSKRPFLSLFLYYSFFYFVWTFSAYRQAIPLIIGPIIILQDKSERIRLPYFLVLVSLGFFHASGFILPILYVISKLKIQYSQVFKISISVFLISFMLNQFILNILILTPIGSRIIPYISSNVSFFDFKSLVRIGFLSVALFMYPLLKDKDNLKIMNIFIFSLNIYFLLKASETAASRVSIYGYILIILIIPNILEILIENKFFSELFVLTLLFAVVYFGKELNTMRIQTGMVLNNRYVPYTSVFIKEQVDFEHRHKSLVERIERKSKENK